MNLQAAFPGLRIVHYPADDQQGGEGERWAVRAIDSAATRTNGPLGGVLLLAAQRDRDGICTLLRGSTPAAVHLIAACLAEALVESWPADHDHVACITAITPLSDHVPAPL